MKKIEEFTKDSLLYQELDSLKPRVSRRERLSQKGTSDCPECINQELAKTRYSVKLSYRLFLTMILIFLGIFQISKILKKEDLIYTNDYKLFRYQDNQTISVSFINDKNRYGISLLMRNKNNNPWVIDTVHISEPNLINDLSIPLNIKILNNKFATKYISLPTNVQNLENIKIYIE